jgi:hypothetical protein
MIRREKITLYHAAHQAPSETKKAAQAAFPQSDRDRRCSALARLETRIALADNEDLAAAAHDFAIAMARFGGFE